MGLGVYSQGHGKKGNKKQTHLWSCFVDSSDHHLFLRNLLIPTILVNVAMSFSMFRTHTIEWTYCPNELNLCNFLPK